MISKKEHPSIKPVALSIAGSDSGGGAGIQADIRTFSSCGVFPTTVITALTAQNPFEVRDVLGIPETFVISQLQTIVDCFDIKAIKTGMLYRAEIIHNLCLLFRTESFCKKKIPIVVDPVMISTSGAKLVSDEAIDIYKNQLLPLCTLMTPNIDEACVLLQDDHSTDIVIDQYNQLQMARQLHQKYACAVLLKGGHLEGHPTDILIEKDGRETQIQHVRLNNICSHGTGCSLSAAITAGLAKGWDIQKSVQIGLHFVQSALQEPCQVDIIGKEEPIQLLDLEK